MDRLTGTDEGFTLLELVIATVLFSVVLLAASNLLISFGSFSSNLVKSETSLIGTSLGAFEEITGKIEIANQVAIPSAGAAIAMPPAAYPANCVGINCIQIRVNTPGSPADHTGDTVYTYWWFGTQLFKFSCTGTAGCAVVAAGTSIADNITKLEFDKDPILMNHITVTLDAQAHSGAGGNASANNLSRENLVTTAIMGSRSSNLA